MIVTSIEPILSYIRTLRESKSRIVVVIDGRGGAGKSTLARELVSNTQNSTHIEYDWFHLPREKIINDERYNHERILKELLRPFLDGEERFCFQRYNWGYLAGIEDGFHESLTYVENKDVLIIEGCKLLHHKLLPFFDLKIWLNTPAEIALQRGIKRDIEEYKLDPERVKSSWKEWSAWEDQSLSQNDRSRSADFLVSLEGEY